MKRIRQDVAVARDEAALVAAPADPLDKRGLARLRDHEIADGQILDQHLTRRRENVRAGAVARHKVRGDERIGAVVGEVEIAAGETTEDVHRADRHGILGQRQRSVGPCAAVRDDTSHVDRVTHDKPMDGNGTKTAGVVAAPDVQRAPLSNCSDPKLEIEDPKLVSMPAPAAEASSIPPPPPPTFPPNVALGSTMSRLPVLEPN